MKSAKPSLGLSVLLASCIVLPLQAATVNNADRINSATEQFLEEILDAAGLQSATVSRGSSTPAKQARVMYDYYLRAGAPNCNQGVYEERKACALDTYGSIGDAAINAISDWENRDGSIAEMTATIAAEIERTGEGRNQMAHVPIEGRYAVDIKPSSVGNHEAFRAAVLGHRAVIRERFFWPGKVGGPAETAYHIEFLVD